MRRICILIFSIIFISSCGGGGSAGNSGGINSSLTPSVNLSASATSVPHYTFVNINWSSTNTSKCSALSADGPHWSEIGGNNLWTNKITTSGNQQIQVPYGLTTFVITCDTNLGTSITDSITINGYHSFNMASMVNFYSIYSMFDEPDFEVEPSTFYGYMFTVNQNYNSQLNPDTSNTLDPIASFMCVYQVRLDVTYQDINTAVISNFHVEQTADLQLLYRPDNGINFYETNLSPLYNQGQEYFIDTNTNNSKVITNSIDIDYYNYLSTLTNPEDMDINTIGSLSIDFTDEEIESDPCLVDVVDAKLFMTPNFDEDDRSDAAMVGWQNHDLGFTVIYLESYGSNGNYHRFNQYWTYYEGFKFTIDDNLNLSLNRIDFNLGSLNKNSTAGSLLNSQANYDTDIFLPYDLSLASPVDNEDFNGNINQSNDYAFKRLFNDCNSDYTACYYDSFKPNLGLMINPSNDCFNNSNVCNTTSPYQLFFSFNDSDEIFAFDIIDTGYSGPITSISEMRLWVGW